MPLNQLKLDQLETGSVFPITASYALSSSAGSGGTSLTTGSTYPITSSWSNNSITASYYGGNVTSASYSLSSSYSNKSLSSSYSTTASNLSPVTQDLIPITGSTYSLGSPTNKWKDLYVSTGSIYIGDTIVNSSGSTLLLGSNPIVTLNTSSGQLVIPGVTASLSASYSNTSSVSLNSISSSYSLTASYALNASGGTTNWTSSNLTSSVSTSSIAAFNSTGSPILVSPPSDNTYLVYQNGILKWIPIASVAVSILNSTFNEEESIIDGLYQSTITSVAFVSSFTSGSI